MCVCGGSCLDKYISIATWPLQKKIPNSVPNATRLPVSCLLAVSC